MTTLLIDDELGSQARDAAATQGKTLDQFVSEVLKQAVRSRTFTLSERSGLPVIEVSPAITIDPQAIERSLQEEGF